MLKRLLYTFVVLLLLAYPSYAHIADPGSNRVFMAAFQHIKVTLSSPALNNDTNRVKRPVQSNRIDVLDRNIIKELPKTKRQPKPEKIVAPTDTSSNNKKARSKLRPEGMERPPDIIRRNNN